MLQRKRKATHRAQRRTPHLKAYTFDSDFPNMWDLCEGLLGLVVGGGLLFILALFTDWWLTLVSLSSGGLCGVVFTRRKIAAVIEARQDPNQHADQSVDIFGCFFLLAVAVMLGLIVVFGYVLHLTAPILWIGGALASYIMASGGAILLIGCLGNGAAIGPDR